jgi:hypothetical protein
MHVGEGAMGGDPFHVGLVGAEGTGRSGWHEDGGWVCMGGHV